MYRHVLSQACQPHCPCNLPANRLSLPFPSHTADRYLAESSRPSSSIFRLSSSSSLRSHRSALCPLLPIDHLSLVCAATNLALTSAHTTLVPYHTPPTPYRAAADSLLHSWVPPATATHRHTHNPRTHALTLLYSSSTVAVVAASSQRPPRSPS